MSEKIFIGVAWPYANSPLHLGHIAGAYLPPDIFARYHRMKGNDVLMVSGSDQHGTPITIRAEQEGKAGQKPGVVLGQQDMLALGRRGLSGNRLDPGIAHAQCIERTMPKHAPRQPVERTRFFRDPHRG